ncbi:hypothetical protein EUGRSUZ_J02963 [Eucalyptus grandis]|uniref:Uncharacterized protein n=4 Tax=Eucalyptus grandis TaxID=71139 RepID=A0ACC3J9K6_EUCGR|nr:hypothetical protein EUGRSUZ_J02963 [Eucalyptus grandis]
MVDWARPLLTQALEDGNFDAIIDPKLNKDYITEEITRMIACAAACVRHSARHRPSMTQVVRALEGNFSMSGLRAYNRCQSSDYDTSQDQEDSKEFRMMAMESQEQATREFSGHNSEDGFNHPLKQRGSTDYQEMDLGNMAEEGRHASGGS